MKKVFSSNAQLAHSWANSLQEDGRGSNMFFNGYTIYSYGAHYEIAKFVTAKNGQKVCFVNSNGYSNTTAKHTAHVWNAIPDGIPTFKVPFISGSSYYYGAKQQYFNVELLGGIISAMLVECKNLCTAQIKARTNFRPFLDAKKQLNNIVEICTLFELELPQRPDNYEEARLKNEHLINTQKERADAREQKELQKSIELLEKWTNHEYNGQLYNIPVHLRVSRDGQLIETTKGAKVGIEAATRLLNRLRNNEDVKGEKIDGFTLIENNTDHVKIGCHVINWSIINKIFN